MKRIPAARPYFPPEDVSRILEDIREVLEGGRLILGKWTRALEERWAERVGVRHAVAVNSCSAALEIAYRYYGVADREVIVPTNTFVATAVSVLEAGGRVTFVDILEEDFCLDVDQAIAAMGPNTAAVVAVHISGFVPRDLERLRSACQERGVALIEDCAHAHGTTWEGRWAGSLGNAGCFSLYPTKVITSGVGGVLTTDDAKLAELARSLRHHGQGSSLEEIVHAGNDWLMDEVRAVMAARQLDRLDEFLARRREAARRYDELLGSDPRISLPRLAPGVRPAYYKYPVLLPPGIDRDAVRKRLLEEHEIECGALYSPPCHLMPLFQERLGTRRGQFPTAEALLDRQICLPMHALVTPADVERVVAAPHGVLRKLA